MINCQLTKETGELNGVLVFVLTTYICDTAKNMRSITITAIGNRSSIRRPAMSIRGTCKRLLISLFHYKYTYT